MALISISSDNSDFLKNIGGLEEALNLPSYSDNLPSNFNSTYGKNYATGIGGVSMADFAKSMYQGASATPAAQTSTAPSLANFGGTDWKGGTINTTTETGRFWDSDVQTYTPLTATNPNGREYIAMQQYNADQQAKVDAANSPFSGLGDGLKGFANAAGGLSSIMGIYTGFEQLGIMKDQLSMAKDRLQITKKEIYRVGQLRNKLNKQYMA